ncbi:MAG: hypothetical protein ACJ8AT_05345 [Hyalangium sp.]|uniref:hypothetical protein n=1 Tax=Hyalangium sp. TaxID=2028555 RepID=UPI00389B0939
MGKCRLGLNTPSSGVARSAGASLPGCQGSAKCTLELRCLEKNGAGRWNLELNVRMKE